MILHRVSSYAIQTPKCTAATVKLVELAICVRDTETGSVRVAGAVDPPDVNARKLHDLPTTHEEGSDGLIFNS